MSWASRIHHPPATPPLKQLRDAAENLAGQAGVPPGKMRVVFQTVADAALLGTVVLSGALAAVHLYKTLFPRRKDDHPTPEPAGSGRSPPRRPPTVTAIADNYDGHDSYAPRSR